MVYSCRADEENPTTTGTNVVRICRKGYGTKIMKAIIYYLRDLVKCNCIQIKWMPYLKSGIADYSSKAAQFFVDNMKFEISSKSGLAYLTLDVKKHYSSDAKAY
jgi:hypothetical protein